MHNTTISAAERPILTVTDTLIFDVVKRTGLDFGVVSNVLFATRSLAAEALTT